MRKRVYTLLSSLFLAGLMANVGCEFTTGGDSSNTSQGAGITINLSGFYKGILPGGLAVSENSGGNIINFVVNQTGNFAESIDNKGNRYTGEFGSPGLVTDLSGGVIPKGAELAQAQVRWSGKDGNADKNIEFVGIIHVVAIADIKGDVTQTDTIDGGVTTTTREFTGGPGGTNLLEETTIVTVVPGGSVTTKITKDRITGETISTTETFSEGEVTSRSQVTGFALTEANNQLRLEGTWIEAGGVVARVDALSAGTAGIVSTTPGNVEGVSGDDALEIEGDLEPPQSDIEDGFDP